MVTEIVSHSYAKCGEDWKLLYDANILIDGNKKSIAKFSSEDMAKQNPEALIKYLEKVAKKTEEAKYPPR